jgi:hypothetical protein
MSENETFSEEDERRIESLIGYIGDSREEAIRRHKNRMKYVNSRILLGTFFLEGPGSEDD